jgi:AAA domain
VRLLGDPMQLTAVEAGGALRLLAHAGPTAQLDRVHRFLDPAEAQATLRLREGQVSALGFYQAAGRLADGSRAAMIEAIYDGWSADLAAGRSALMVSALSAEVAALSARARRDRVVAGSVEADGVALHDGNQAGVGDLIVTRENQRALQVCGGRDFVKNGDIWAVTGRHANGDLTVRHHEHGGPVRLPAAYVAGERRTRLCHNGSPRAGDDGRRRARPGRQDHVIEDGDAVEVERCVSSLGHVSLAGHQLLSARSSAAALLGSGSNRPR